MKTNNILLRGLIPFAGILAIFTAWSIAAIPLSRSHPVVMGAGAILLVVILLRPHYGALVMVATFWLSTLFPDEGGLTLNRMVGIITLAGIVFPLITTRAKKTKYGFKKLDYFIFGFLGIVLLSVVVNGAYPRTTGYVWELLMGYLLYWLILNTIDSRNRLETILWVIVACNVVVAISVVNTFVTSGSRVGLQRFGGLQQVNTIGMFGAVATLIVLWLFQQQGRGGYRSRFGVLKYGLVVLFVGAMLLTGNRSGFVALLSSLFVIGLFASNRRGKISVFPAVGLIIASAFVIASVAPATVDRVLNIPAGILSQATSAEELDILDRLQINQGAWRMFTANPVFGVGFGGFGYQLGKYVPQRVGSTSVAHNMFASTLAEMGILGFVMLLAIFGTFFFRMWKHIRSASALKGSESDAIYVLALFVGVSVNGLLHGVTIDKLMFIVFALGTIVVQFLENDKNTSSHLYPAV